MREIGASFVAVASVLTVIFLAYSLTRFLNDAASGLFDTREVWSLTIYKAIIALEVLLPIGFYFGLIVGFGRLSNHGELTAIRAGGMTRSHIQLPLMMLALLLAAIIALLSFNVRPWAYAAMYGLKDAAQASSELDRIKPQRFYVYDDNARVVYVNEIERGGTQLSGIFIREKKPDALQIISAPRGQLRPYATKDSHRLTLDEALIFRSGDLGTDFLGKFSSLSLSLPAQKELDQRYRRKAEPTGALATSNQPFDRAELQWRLSTPLSVVILTVIAFAMLDMRPRHSAYSRLPLALALYAVYYNLLGLGRTWIEQGSLSNLWWTHLVMVALMAGWKIRTRRELL